MNALLKTGIRVQRAAPSFEVKGKTYPAGSYVVKTAQAFRPHVMDMFEPQVHPNDFLYPGGPPVPPYDSAGWTLALQMGIEFDSIRDGFDGPFVTLEAWRRLLRQRSWERPNRRLSDQPPHERFLRSDQSPAESGLPGILAGESTLDRWPGSGNGCGVDTGIAVRAENSRARRNTVRNRRAWFAKGAGRTGS